MKIPYSKIEVFLSVFTLIATTFLTIGTLFFTVKYQGKEIENIQQNISTLQDNSFTISHALRDFKFVKDDENLLHQRLDSQIQNILSLSQRMNNQTKSVMGVEGRLVLLEAQLNCKTGK